MNKGFKLALFLMLFGCQRQYSVGMTDIRFVLYREEVGSEIDFWSLEEITDLSAFSNVISLCKNDYREDLKLYCVCKSNKIDIIYFVFEGTKTDDLMVAYAYNINKKTVLYKFRIPMA